MIQSSHSAGHRGCSSKVFQFPVTVSMFDVHVEHKHFLISYQCTTSSREEHWNDPRGLPDRILLPTAGFSVNVSQEVRPPQPCLALFSPFYLVHSGVVIAKEDFEPTSPCFFSRLWYLSLHFHLLVFSSNSSCYTNRNYFLRLWIVAQSPSSIRSPLMLPHMTHHIVVHDAPDAWCPLHFLWHHDRAPVCVSDLPRHFFDTRQLRAGTQAAWLIPQQWRSGSLSSLALGVAR